MSQGKPRARHISFMVTRLEPAGAEKQLVYVALGLRARGWQVDVLSLMPPVAFAPTLEAAGVSVRSLGVNRKREFPRAFVRALQTLRKTRPSILCTFNYHADIIGRVAGKLARVPVVTSSIRNEKFGGRSRDLLVRLTTPLTPVTTTNSRLAADALVRRGVVPEKRMRVVPNAIVSGDYLPNADTRQRVRSELGLGDDAFVWLNAARLEPQKDQANLLTAFSALDEGNVLLLAGEGSLRAELGAQAERLKLTDRVKFLGLRSDIPALLSAADAFVLSSAYEGLPNVVMEAQAAGLAVVATDVGGTRELVETGKSGLVVPPANSPALAEAMRQLADLKPDTRRAWGDYGQTHIRERYDLATVVEQWETLFLDLLKLA